MSIEPTKRRICILEDDAAVSDSLRLLLERNGFAVTTFAAAGEFLTGSDPDSFDCLILDQRLPVLSGLELAELLRARAYSKPVILIWGQPQSELMTRIRRAGISETLVKPTAPPVLVAAVERALHCPGEALRT